MKSIFKKHTKLFQNFVANDSTNYFNSIIQKNPIFQVNLLLNSITRTFATKMRGTVTKNKKDSAGRRLGLKKFGGEEVFSNDILVRQRGFKFHPGENVHYGKDHTLHASKEGKILYTTDPWYNKKRNRVHVVEQEIPNRYIQPPLPFMYHPELYPELAKKNGELTPIPTKFVIVEPRSEDENRELKILKRKEKIINHMKKAFGFIRVGGIGNNLKSESGLYSELINRFARGTRDNRKLKSNVNTSGNIIPNCPNKSNQTMGNQEIKDHKCRKISIANEIISAAKENLNLRIGHHQLNQLSLNLDVNLLNQTSLNFDTAIERLNSYNKESTLVKIDSKKMNDSYEKEYEKDEENEDNEDNDEVKEEAEKSSISVDMTKEKVLDITKINSQNKICKAKQKFKARLNRIKVERKTMTKLQVRKTKENTEVKDGLDKKKNNYTNKIVSLSQVFSTRENLKRKKTNI